MVKSSGMKKNITQLPGSEVDLEVTLSKDEFIPYVELSRADALKNISVKGFRPGMAPEHIASAGVDPEKVYTEAVHAAARETLNDIRDERQWVFIDAPKIEVTETTEAEGGLRFKARLTLFPDVALGDYKKIAGRILAERRPQPVGEEEIEKTLSWLRDSRAVLTRAVRPAAQGDLVEADVSSRVDGKPLEGGALAGDRFVLGASRYVPGFDQHLIGHTEGERINFALAAPADYWKKDLQNKNIDFSVRVKAVFERTLPELTDEFAIRLGRDFKTIAQVRENIRQGLVIEKEKKERDRLRAKMMEEIGKAARAGIPPVMVERTLDGLVEEVRELAPAGLTAQYTNEQLRADLREQATARVLAHLIIYKIAKNERLEPIPDEVNEESKRQNLDLKKYYDYSYGIAQNRKVFEFLEKI